MADNDNANDNDNDNDNDTANDSGRNHANNNYYNNYYDNDVVSAVLGDDACEDTADFLDGLGNDCATNVSYDCADLNSFVRMGYTVDEWQSVLDNCPVSCGLCEHNGRRQNPSVTIPLSSARLSADPDSNAKPQAQPHKSDVGSQAADPDSNASIPPHTAAPKKVTPAFRWAQRRDALLLEIKFAHKLDAPSCAYPTVTDVLFGPHTMNMTGRGKGKLFGLDLHFWKEIVPEVCDVSCCILSWWL